MTNFSQPPANSEPEANEQLAQAASQFAGLSNTELAVTRTDLASDRTDMAEIRTDLARDRNRLAAERTLMSWIRTSLSMITFGFGIDRFFAYLKQAEVETSFNRISEERVLGLSLITLGVFALLASAIIHWRLLKNLEQRQFRYLPTWSLGITVAIVLVFIGLASYIPLITQGINLMEIFNLNSQIVQNLASLTVFSIMLALGIELPMQNLLDFWQKPGLLGRSLLAVIGLPVIMLALTLYALDLPVSFEITLILLVASPGPALLTRRAGMAGARMEYVISLQITLALLAIVITPLTLQLFNLLFPTERLGINLLQVAKQVGIVQFLPLSVGLAIRTIWKDLADEINSLLKTIANTLFIVMALLILVVSLDVVPTLGIKPLIVTIVLSLMGLTIGHLLGIGLAPDIQSAIAVAVIARNVGLAIAIATFNGQVKVVPIIIGALIVGIVAGVPYTVWMKQKIAQSKAESPIDAAVTSFP
ncbi:MAG: DUF202 domain-containing protein [Chroococcidiopsidaceae cyanobacterium CP_BM_ER_R8_30]|nr:DUF202 domain-containing protein [Chroococcidiopsidaceae cyanobacterium CP_BM_ER_R8_30]